MSELMKINKEDNTITARELYEFLELDKSQFSRWCKKNIEENSFATENIDFVRLDIQDETPTGGKITRTDYRLSIDFAKKLCMVSKSPKGEQARSYFIEVEKQLKQLVDQPLAMPKDYSSALRALADEYDARKLAESIVAELAPKAEAFDVFIGGEGYYSMNATAKMLGTGRNKLYKKLRELQIIMKESTQPYQRYVTNGWFTVKASVKNGFSRDVTLVTPKGVESIRNLQIDKCKD